MILLLRTSTIDEFFKFYEEFVPNEYIPSVRLYNDIVNELKFHEEKAVAKYVARIWSDVNLFGYTNLSLKLDVISLMEIACLPAESPLRTVFVDAAWTLWNDIKVGCLFIYYIYIIIILKTSYYRWKSKINYKRILRFKLR